MSKESIYFPNLNGLRAIAAFSVLIAHIEIYKTFVGFPALISGVHSHMMGIKAVSLFFSLSGFLITFILLSELKVMDSIDVKKFWIKRALRILPLYFLIVFLGFFLLPKLIVFKPWHDNYVVNSNVLLPFYLLLLPNLTTLIHGPIPFVGMFWSVGVEEQFYLFWPLLLKKIKRNILPILLSILGGVIALRAIYFYLAPQILNDYFTRFVDVQGAAYGISTFLMRLQFECMAIGGIGAYLLINRHKVLAFIYRKEVQILTLSLIALFMYTGAYFAFLDSLIYGVLFTALILNVGSNPTTLISLENKPLDYLGKISYGVYSYHFSAIVIMLNVLPSFGLGGFAFNALLYSCSIAITLLVSILSYEYFEKPFLKLKKRHMVVESRVNYVPM